MSTLKKVLVFDDDQDLLSIFRFLFEDEGWAVFTFENCDELLARTASISPDLILMDNWILPDGGIKATQMLKNDPASKQIPVIYVSANNEIQKLADEAGADAYVEKPFDFDVLSKLARELTDKEQ